jgi:hypothetical protein
MSRIPLPACLVAALIVVSGVAACKKRHRLASHKKHQTGYTTVEALGRGVFEAIHSKTLFRVRHLFPTQALYDRYFTCSAKPISGMGRYHADGLYGVMRHKTEHGKVVVKTIKPDQPMLKKKGDPIGTCRFNEDVPHKLLTVTYSYRVASKLDPPPKANAKPKLTTKLGSWSFVTVNLAGRWYLFIILAMDGTPIDEIGLPGKNPTAPPSGRAPPG